MAILSWIRGVVLGAGPELEQHGVEELRDLAGLDAALAHAENGVIGLFKHSTTCPISSSAHREVQQYLRDRAGGPPVYLIKVIESRPVSNKVAERLGVTHQSPQFIVVRSGKATWNASHGAVTAGAIARAMRNGASA